MGMHLFWNNFRRYLPLFILLLILLFVLLLVAVKIVSSLDYRNSDFFSFWLAGLMARTGQNPYDSNLWVAGHIQSEAEWVSDPFFLYPLPLAIFTSPISLLPLKEAFEAWVFLAEISIIASILLLIKQTKETRNKHMVLPLLAAAFLFRPTLVAFHNGQLAPFILFIICLTIFLWENEKWTLGGALIAFTVIKPTLGIPIIFFAVFWLFLRGKNTTILVIALSIAAIMIFGLLKDPSWIFQFLRGGNLKLNQTFGYHPNLWGLIRLFSVNYLQLQLLIGCILSGLLLIFTMYILLLNRQLSAAAMFSLAIPVVLLVTPYTWAYDQVLLLVTITVSTFWLFQKRKIFLIAALFPISISILALVFLYISTLLINDRISAFVPLLCYFTAGLGIWMTHKSAYHLPPFKKSSSPRII